MQEQHITRILNNIAEEHIPTANLWPAIQAQVQPRKQRSQHRGFQRTLALAAVLVLAIIGTFIWIGRPPAVSAEAILQQAQVVADDPLSSGVQGFVRTETISYTHSWVWPQSPQGHNEAERFDSTLYYQEPNRTRYESETNEGSVLTVNDGTNYWVYYPEINGVYTGEAPQDMSLSFPFARSDISSLLAEFKDCYDAGLRGDDKVADRDTFIVQLMNTRCASPDSPQARVGDLTLWVDKETHFILKTIVYDPQNEVPIYTAEVTDIRYNADLNPELFTFTPPPDAIIQEAGRPPSN